MELKSELILVLLHASRTCTAHICGICVMYYHNLHIIELMRHVEADFVEL